MLEWQERQLGSAVEGDIGEVDRDQKGQFEFPYCLDSTFKVIIFLTSE